MPMLMRSTALGLLVASAACAAALVAQQRSTRPLPKALARASETTIGPVESEMRNVDYRVDDRVTLKIAYLRGTLRSTRPNEPPWFDDPTSFDIAIDSAVVAVTPASLTALMNTYVFNYPGADIKKLVIRIEGSELVQTGVLDKAINVPFTIRSRVSVTPDGRLRLQPTSVRVVGIGVTRLMGALDIELSDMVKVRGGRGVVIENDDFILAPELLLPPPRIKSRVKSVRIVNGELVQTLVARTPRNVPRIVPPHKASNYMLYQGRVLRFGKLTMNSTDLQIVDADPSDAFDFYLSHLNDQLVAGSSRTLRDYGLVTTMPDYSDLRRPAKKVAAKRP